jgi:hypothetical protein
MSEVTHIQTDNTWLISEDRPEDFFFEDDSPCDGCPIRPNCGKALQACQAYRKYETYGKFDVKDVSKKFKGL